MCVTSLPFIFKDIAIHLSNTPAFQHTTTRDNTLPHIVVHCIDNYYIALYLHSGDCFVLNKWFALFLSHYLTFCAVHPFILYMFFLWSFIMDLIQRNVSHGTINFQRGLWKHKYESIDLWKGATFTLQLLSDVSGHTWGLFYQESWPVTLRLPFFCIILVC